jgi:hypothetical protein
MPTVFIPPPLRELTSGMAEIVVDGETVRQVVEALDRRPGTFRGQISGDILGGVGPDDSPWG